MESATQVIPSSPSSDVEEIRPIFCLKSKYVDMRKVEEKYDCFILDFDDPLDTIQWMTNFSINASEFLDSLEDEDIFHIAEKGQVATRDYPHSRHLCVKYPFEETPHESCCNLCYCYVCDLPAPCECWTDEISAHCNASEYIGDWKIQRTMRRNGKRISTTSLLNF